MSQSTKDDIFWEKLKRTYNEGATVRCENPGRKRLDIDTLRKGVESCSVELPQYTATSDLIFKHGNTILYEQENTTVSNEINIENEQRICRDCLHSNLHGKVHGNYCNQSKNEPVDLISGEPKSTYCEYNRSELGDCKPEGLLFDKKVSVVYTEAHPIEPEVVMTFISKLKNYLNSKL